MSLILIVRGTLRIHRGAIGETWEEYTRDIK